VLALGRRRPGTVWSLLHHEPILLNPPLRCRDTIGIVAAVASALAASGAFIVESSHFGDEGTCLFFMRTVFRTAGPRFPTLEDFRVAPAPVVQRFEMRMTRHDAAERMKVMLAVSRHGHCLNHLLHRRHSGELPVEVVGVVSNHDDMRCLAEWYGLSYCHLPLQGDKPAQEAGLVEALRAEGVECLTRCTVFGLYDHGFAAALQTVRGVVRERLWKVRAQRTSWPSAPSSGRCRSRTTTARG
jgi:formyltetrahydrofolate hydrolase